MGVVQNYTVKFCKMYVKPRPSATGTAFYSSLYFNTVLLYGVGTNGFGLHGLSGQRNSWTPQGFAESPPPYDIEEAFSDQDNKPHCRPIHVYISCSLHFQPSFSGQPCLKYFLKMVIVPNNL